MGVLKEISSLIKPYISLFTFAVIAVADYIWEDKYFTCPCVNDNLRASYSVAFVLSPAIYLFLANSNFRSLCRTCQNFCTDTFWKNLVNLLRPFVIAGAWMVYSLLDPRFSDCIEKEFNRVTKTNCTEQDRLEGKTRASIAITLLSLSLLALTFAGLVGCCRGCRCKRRSTCCESCLFENLTPERKLTGQTLIILEEEDLLEDSILKDLGDSDFQKLESKLTMGQLRILKDYCEQIKSPTPQGSGEGNATGAAPADDKSGKSGCWPGCCEGNKDSLIKSPKPQGSGEENAAADAPADDKSGKSGCWPGCCEGNKDSLQRGVGQSDLELKTLDKARPPKSKVQENTDIKQPLLQGDSQPSYNSGAGPESIV